MPHTVLATAHRLGDLLTTFVAAFDASLLACATLPWRDGAGRLRVTAIVKVTYALTPGAIAELASPLPLTGDLPRVVPGPTAARDGLAPSLLSPSDHVPLKAHAEVTLVGRVVPGPTAPTRQVVGFALARGADVLLTRRLVAVGARPRAGAPRVALEPFPASYEHTWGGPGHADNPVGSVVDSDGPTPPLLVDPEAIGRPAGFGPLAATWAPRAGYLAPGQLALLSADPLALPGDLDLRFFQSAPATQWTAPFRGGERILLAGFHPDAAPVVCQLPALHAFARIDGPGAARKGVPLRGDSLWIDTDRMLATVTFRGSLELERRHAAAAFAAGAFTLRPGLAPCEDVEAVLARPLAWSLPLVPATPRPSPAVDPITLENDSGLAAGTLAWTLDGKTSRRAVIVKGTFDLAPSGGPVTLAPTQDALHGDHLADGSDPATQELDRASDFVPLKPRADVLLRGTAHAPPTKSTALVSLTLGSLRARVVALPPRTWGQDGVPRPSGPFAPVPLRHANAFGGPGFGPNPAGTGATPGTPPPLLEDPDRLLRTRTDRVTPATFAPLAPTWEPRRALLGSFDPTWQRERWPGLPADFDPAHFQAAPEALRHPHFNGDEPFRIESVRPGGAALEGTLPGLRPRAFIVRAGAEPVEVPLHLDTVVFDADTLRVALVWRGSFDPRATPARVVVLADAVSAPRPLDDLATLLCARAARPLAPTPSPPGAPAPGASPYPLRDLLRRAAQPQPRGAPGLPLALAVAAGATVFAAAARARPAPLPPPPPPTRAAVEAMLAAGKDLRHLDLSGAALAGIDLSGRDLSGALLANADLSRATLAGATFTGATLAGILAPSSSWNDADLTGADLTAARLASATFLRAKLTRAKLADADLTAADLTGIAAESVSLVRAHLPRARLDTARLPKADFSSAAAPGATFTKAVLDDASFLDTDVTKAVFDDASLADARFENARLASASFVNVAAAGAVFEQSDLTGATLHKADLTAAVFSGATLRRADLRAVAARGALFREADLQGARLDGADLMRASFEAANLRGATLTGANLYQAETWLAATAEADLTGALLAGTKLAPRGAR